MSSFSFERLFSMGAFDALRSIRQQALHYPDLDRQSIVALLQATDSEMSGLDFVAAQELHDLVTLDAPSGTPHEFYRHCITSVILGQRRSWSRSITLGRSRFLNQLSRDEHLCFRAALLTDSPPPEDVVVWWDTISFEMRHSADKIRMDRARLAERLSIQHERERLAALGIDLEPKWIAIEDNTAGFDVLSFDSSQYGPTNRLIEVKSTIASPLRFFISRNEWEQALKYGSSYHFHIWDLAPAIPRLYERTVPQILPHIPEDQASGKWTNAEIPLGASM